MVCQIPKQSPGRHQARIMEKKAIETIEDLKVFIIEWCEKHPEDDCVELLRDIATDHKWIYTADSHFNYDDEDFVSDGYQVLSFVSEGWMLFPDNSFSEFRSLYDREKKRALVLVDLDDEESFRSEFLVDFPGSWNAELQYEDGVYYLFVADHYQEACKRFLNAKFVRFASCTVAEFMYNAESYRIMENSYSYSIDLQNGLGEVIYLKSDFSLEGAVTDTWNN